MSSMTSRSGGRASILLPLLFGLACGGDPPPPTPASAPRPVPTRRAEPVPSRDRLYVGDRAELDSARVVITDASTLRLWWNRATAVGEYASPPLPPVDFERHMVLLVSAGPSDPGDQIRVDSVGFETVPEPGGGQREVWFAVVRRSVECDPFPGRSHPVEIVRVPRAPLPLDWIEQTTSCPGG